LPKKNLARQKGVSKKKSHRLGTRNDVNTERWAHKPAKGRQYGLNGGQEGPTTSAVSTDLCGLPVLCAERSRGQSFPGECREGREKKLTETVGHGVQPNYEGNAWFLQKGAQPEIPWGTSGFIRLNSCTPNDNLREKTKRLTTC